MLAFRFPGSAQALRLDPVDRHVHLLQRIGARYRPVAAERDPGPPADERADLILPGRAFGPDEGQGHLLHLRFIAGPQRLEVRYRVQCPETGHIPRRDELEMREMV